ncbi:MAG: hypothetical protein M3P01_09025, partial [Actinomycetota bacterium]|nr:hypothetical protein [Actinomycetota bacterium]
MPIKQGAVYRRRRIGTLVALFVTIGVIVLAVRALGRGDNSPDPSTAGNEAGGAGSGTAHTNALPSPPPPFPGYLLIADRGNDRLLLVDGAKHILWRYPHGTPSYPFHFDDDAFFNHGYSQIITNEEDQQTLEILSFPEGKVLWHYGHVNVVGSAPGYLNSPDDAYLLRNSIRTVADAYNCRVLFISPAKKIVRQIGTTGVCGH